MGKNQNNKGNKKNPNQMLTFQQQTNAKLLAKSCNKFGILNRYIQAGIIGTAYKECGLVPVRENLFYSEKAILRVWPNMDKSMVPKLVGNAQVLGNYMYGGKYGNLPNEGYKFRGGGYTQITYKSTYERLGKIVGVDLVADPDKIDDPAIASDVEAAFFAPEIMAGFSAKSFVKFGLESLADVTDTDKGLKVAIQINAGRGTNWQNNIVQEGYIKATPLMPEIYALIQLP